MQTKQDLLDKMGLLGACLEATDWVTNHAADLAADIWQDCTRVDWLCWLAAELAPGALSDFAFGCADRAVRRYAPAALSAAGLHAKAAKLASLPAVVCVQTARAASADAAARYAARYAARAADAAHADAAARAAAYAARYAADAADAAADADAADEITEQLQQLHAMWPRIVEGSCDKL